MKNNIISDIILLIPFFIVMSLHMITTALICTIVGFVSSMMYMKDWIVKHI